MSTIEKALEKFGDGRGKAADKSAVEESLSADAVVPDTPPVSAAEATEPTASAVTHQGEPSETPAAPAASAEDTAPPAAAATVTKPEDSTLWTKQSAKLDWASLRDNGVLDPDSGKASQMAEQMRTIKRPLLMHINGEGASIVKHPNLIMVTSSMPGEGKTFTAMNLAVSLAMEVDKKVLLVDADVAKPKVSKRLGVDAPHGFTDLLSDASLSLQDVLIKTDMPNLMLLPAGQRHSRSTELLASSAMKRLADELATRYSDRVVVFDSPPLLLTTEAPVLAGLMGQIVVVVEESRTTQHVLKEALSLLSGCEIVGLVLNKSKRPGGPDYYGGYGYGYGYGYGN